MGCGASKTSGTSLQKVQPGSDNGGQSPVAQSGTGSKVSASSSPSGIAPDGGADPSHASHYFGHRSARNSISQPDVSGVEFTDKDAVVEISTKFKESGMRHPREPGEALEIGHVLSNKLELEMRIGYRSQKGRTGGTGVCTKKNEDNLICLPCCHDRDESTMVAVLDGHGPDGEFASFYAAQRFQREFLAAGALPLDAGKTEIERTFGTCYEKTDWSLSKQVPLYGVKEGGPNQIPAVQTSGTCAVACLFLGSRLICANVGDCQAYLGTRRAGSDGSGGTGGTDSGSAGDPVKEVSMDDSIRAIPLSFPHDVASEKAKFDAMPGCKVFSERDIHPNGR